MTPTQNAYSRIALITGVFLALFFVGRFALFITYNASFAELGITQLVFSFIHGIRFDAPSS